MSTRRVVVAFSVVFLFFLAACGGGGGGGDETDVVATYNSLTEDPSGMAFDGTNLWMSGDSDPSTTIVQPMFWRIDIATGGMIDTIRPPARISSPGGLAHTGSYMAVLDISRVHYLDNTGSYITSSPIPFGLWYEELAHDGMNFWAADWIYDRVLEFDNSGIVISSFSLPGNAVPNGLAFDGANLWVGEWMSSTVYKVDRNGNTLGTINTGSGILEDLAFDGTYLWGADIFDGTLYKMNVN